ncbi:MAG: SHOCT domain-containing protein [Desulfamplus sp.]|nr:SHOCT domain-containing protein [Desulfamplus sp.]
MKFKPTDKEGIFKSLFAAYFVLLLHVFLVVGVGVAVVLFKGVYEYLPWILSCIAGLVIALFWIFYLRIKRSSTDIQDVLSHPAFQNRNVEIKLLGGVATFKLSAPVFSEENLLAGQHKQNVNLLMQDTNTNQFGQKSESIDECQTPKLESGHTNIERRLSELADLYKRNLIDDQEYRMAKKRILFEDNSISEIFEDSI